MSLIAKQSVRIEMTKESIGGDTRDVLEETFYEAINRIAPEETQLEFLTGQFFTMRFDTTPEGGIAATLTASEKRN